MTHEALMHETRMKILVEDCCKALGWNCEAHAPGFLIGPRKSKDINLSWGERDGKTVVVLLMPLVKDLGPWDALLTRSVLRRNASLASVYWCVSADDKLSIRSVLSPETLTAERLRVTADEMFAELGGFVSGYREHVRPLIEMKP